MTPEPFQSFVIFAAMRTGSNFLEESLNLVPGISCMGEAFNPVFIAYPNRTDLLDVTMAARDANPLALLRKINSAAGLTGFRFFPDHDPRILDEIFADARCAKIVLMRNPAESYVSLKIARETGQWKAKDAARIKTAKVSFDQDEFKAHIEGSRTFYQDILRRLQVSGQTAFYLDYDDIGDTEVLSGLVRFLGLNKPKIAPARSLVPQNPQALVEKIENPAAMVEALSGYDRFNLLRVPNFEPRRGPQVPGYIAAKGAPLLFMPIGSGPTTRVESWLASFGSGEEAGLVSGFTQASLRDWLRIQGQHRRFTVLRHPIARAYVAFADIVLSKQNPEMNEQLTRQYKINLHFGHHVGEHDLNDEREAFGQFLKFLKPNLNGQTNIRVNAAWASQTATLQGFSLFAFPDALIREDQLCKESAALCAELGLECPPWPDGSDTSLARLAAIYDNELESLARQAYHRDYLSFGFGPWRSD